MLCENPNAVHILEANMDKINWDILSENPNAIHILEKNIDKIEWRYLSANPSIFIETCDVKKIPESPHKELLAMKAFCPERMVKCIDAGYDIENL